MALNIPLFPSRVTPRDGISDFETGRLWALSYNLTYSLQLDERRINPMGKVPYTDPLS